MNIYRSVFSLFSQQQIFDQKKAVGSLFVIAKASVLTICLWFYVAVLLILSYLKTATMYN